VQKKNECPVYEVGDQVEITGSWKLASPHGDRNSDGLLVYKKMKNITKSWDSPDLPPEENATGAPARPSPQQMVNQSKKKPG
jgi:hypothetical protein